MEDRRGKPGGPGARRLLGWLLVASIVILSTALAVIVARSHERTVERDQRAEVNRVAVALDSVSSLAVAQLRATAAFIELHPNLAPTTFRRLVNAMLADQPIAAVSYLGVEPLDAARTTAPLRSETHHFPVRLTAIDRSAGQIIPADEESAAHIVDVLEGVGETGFPASTRAVSLRDEANRHLVFFHPVKLRRRGGASDLPAGFTAAVVRTDDLLASAAAVVPAGTSIALVDAKNEILSTSEQPLEDYSSSSVVIAGQSWELRLVVPAGEVSALPLVLGLGGLILAAAIGLLLLNWSRRERRALDLATTRLEERDRAMKAEAEINRMYRLLAENLTDMVIVTDPDGRIIYVSPAGEMMLGWTSDEMAGKFVLDYLHSDDENDARMHLQSLRERAGILTFEHRLRRKDGSHIWVESAIRSVVDSETENVLEIQATTRDISERKPMQDRLEQLAREDPLTGLYNRRQFGEILARELARATRSGGSGALLMIDIDRFKLINDTYGHLTGDRVLRRVSDVMRSRMRVSDTLARFGGDEFAAILPEAAEEEGVTVAQAIIGELRDYFAGKAELPNVTVSIGIAVFDGEKEPISEEILQQADFAMYIAKTSGRDRASVYRPDGAAAVIESRRER